MALEESVGFVEVKVIGLSAIHEGTGSDIVILYFFGWGDAEELVKCNWVLSVCHLL